MLTRSFVHLSFFFGPGPFLSIPVGPFRLSTRSSFFPPYKTPSTRSPHTLAVPSAHRDFCALLFPCVDLRLSCPIFFLPWALCPADPFSFLVFFFLFLVAWPSAPVLCKAGSPVFLGLLLWTAQPGSIQGLGGSPFSGPPVRPGSFIETPGSESVLFLATF